MNPQLEAYKKNNVHILVTIFNNNVSTIFFEYIRSILHDKNINSINDLPLNGVYHINGEIQEEYLDIHQNIFMANILSYLVDNLIALCQNKK